MGKSIQFRNSDELLTGFVNTEAKAWSLWDGKQFLTKGVGVDLLRKFLDAFEDGAQNVIYTLRIYDDIEDSKLIKERTEADGSFNFIFGGEPDEIMGDKYAIGNYKNKLFTRLGAIEEYIHRKIKEEEETEEVDAEPQTIGSLFMDMIKNPSQLTEFVGALNTAKSLFTPGYQMPMQGAIGNVEPATVLKNSIDTATLEQRVARFQAAVNTLELNDPKLLEHLEKLAKISNENKGQFTILTNMLDHM